MYKTGSQKNKIGNKVNDKTGAKDICLGTKRCIRLGARKIKLEIRQLEIKWTRLEPRAKVWGPRHV